MWEVSLPMRQGFGKLFYPLTCERRHHPSDGPLREYQLKPCRPCGLDRLFEDGLRQADDGGLLQPMRRDVRLHFTDDRVDAQKDEGVNPREHGRSLPRPTRTGQKPGGFDDAGRCASRRQHCR